MRIRPAAGASVSIGMMTLAPGVSNVTFESLHFPEGWEAGPTDDGPPVSDVTFRRTTGRLFLIRAALRLAVLGGSYGPSVDEKPMVAVYNPWSTYAPTDITIDGVYFHDFTRSAPDVHTECLQIYSGVRVAVRNSRFDNCDGTGSVQVAKSFSAPVEDVTFAWNWFGPRGDAFYNVQTTLCTGVTFRANAMSKGLYFAACPFEVRPVSAIANTFPWNLNLCKAPARYVSNVVSGGRCSSTDHAVSRRVVERRIREVNQALVSYAHGCGKKRT